LKLATRNSTLVLNPIDRLLAAMAELRQSQSSKSAHFFRTSLRRFEAWASAVEFHPHGREKKAFGFLDRLRRVAGKLRDAEVQRDLLKSLRVTSPRSDRADVNSDLWSQRLRRARKLRKLIESNRFHKVEELLAQWIARYAGSLANPRAELLQKARQDYATFVAIRPELNEDSLHDYRLACKEFRYTAELAGDSPEAAKAIEGWKRVQDTIGDWHDWMVLRDLAVSTVQSSKKSRLVAAITRHCLLRMRRAVRTVEQLEQRMLKKPVESVSSVEFREKAKPNSR
jgi:CHAD domain-containing protein